MTRIVLLETGNSILLLVSKNQFLLPDFLSGLLLYMSTGTAHQIKDMQSQIRYMVQYT